MGQMMILMKINLSKEKMIKMIESRIYKNYISLNIDTKILFMNILMYKEICIFILFSSNFMVSIII